MMVIKKKANDTKMKEKFMMMVQFMYVCIYIVIECNSHCKGSYKIKIGNNETIHISRRQRK